MVCTLGAIAQRDSASVTKFVEEMLRRPTRPVVRKNQVVGAGP